MQTIKSKNIMGFIGVQFLNLRLRMTFFQGEEAVRQLYLDPVIHYLR